MTRSTTALLFLLLTLVLSMRATAVRSAEPADLGPHLKKLRAVGVEGQGHREAMHAWKQLSQADASQLTAILGGMKGAGKLADNWFRAVVRSEERRVGKGGRCRWAP